MLPFSDITISKLPYHYLDLAMVPPLLSPNLTNSSLINKNVNELT